MTLNLQETQPKVSVPDLMIETERKPDSKDEPPMSLDHYGRRVVMQKNTRVRGILKSACSKQALTNSKGKDKSVLHSVDSADMARHMLSSRHNLDISID